MKALSITVTSVAVAMSMSALAPVSAFLCSDAQIQQAGEDENVYIRPACPALYDAAGDAILVPKDIDKLTAGSFSAVSKCGAKQCVTELRSAAEITPNCDMLDTTLSLPAWFTALANLCEALASGSVHTVADARSFFDDQAITRTPAPTSRTPTPTPTPRTPTPTPTATEEDTPATSKPVETPKPTPTPSPTTSKPSPTPKSGSSSVAFAGLTVVVGSVFVSSLLV